MAQHNIQADLPMPQHERGTENYLWWIDFCLKLSVVIWNLKLLVYGLFFQIVSRVDRNIKLWYVKLQSCSTTKLKWLTIVYCSIQIYKLRSSKVRSLQNRIRGLIRVAYICTTILSNKQMPRNVCRLILNRL